jgi:predicted RNA binding protein YcfA (HicA-like mRNA interferase family)
MVSSSDMKPDRVIRAFERAGWENLGRIGKHFKLQAKEGRESEYPLRSRARREVAKEGTFPCASSLRRDDLGRISEVLSLTIFFGNFIKQPGWPPPCCGRVARGFQVSPARATHIMEAYGPGRRRAGGRGFPDGSAAGSQARS